MESQAWNPEARDCTTTSTPLEAYGDAGYSLRPGLGDHCEPSPNRECLGKHEVNTSRIPMESTTSIEDFLPLSELFDDDDIETDVQPIRTLDVKTAFLQSEPARAARARRASSEPFC